MSKPNNQSNQQINTAALRGTREEWDKKHRDFKATIKGQRFFMAWSGTQGTCLVPVGITQ